MVRLFWARKDVFPWMLRPSELWQIKLWTMLMLFTSLQLSHDYCTFPGGKKSHGRKEKKNRDDNWARTKNIRLAIWGTGNFGFSSIPWLLRLNYTDYTLANFGDWFKDCCCELSFCARRKKKYSVAYGIENANARDKVSINADVISELPAKVSLSRKLSLWLTKLQGKNCTPFISVFSHGILH